MLIKVCGMRDADNIKDLCQLRVDYMGFIFHSASPRCVDFNVPIELPSTIRKVGVFRDASLDTILSKVEICKLDVVQLHGSETAHLCKELKSKGLEVFKAFGLSDGFDFSSLVSYIDVCDMFVFDTKSKLGGGSGLKFNWDILCNYHYPVPYLLSGGIGPDDASLIKHLDLPLCAGVDLNSQFEVSPGLKDIDRLRCFVASLRSTE